MNVESTLTERSGSSCELCSENDQLEVYEVPSDNGRSPDTCVLLCETCRGKIEQPTPEDANHWRCLNESMWSQVPAVQVLAWRLLNSLKSEGWPLDLLDMLCLEDDIQKWAEADSKAEQTSDTVSTRDSNGTALNTGDSVTLIKDLVVKGAGFTAKRGTTVKNIKLTSNSKHVEGRVNGTQIVLVAEYLKKSAG